MTEPVRSRDAFATGILLVFILKLWYEQKFGVDDSTHLFYFSFLELLI